MKHMHYRRPRLVLFLPAAIILLACIILLVISILHNIHPELVVPVIFLVLSLVNLHGAYFRYHEEVMRGEIPQWRECPQIMACFGFFCIAVAFFLALEAHRLPGLLLAIIACIAGIALLCYATYLGVQRLKQKE
ncbi:hypothetical protein EI42_03583 [Thermosporothrix hazakensis]|jgi:O-antigen/teichoic acid export membrane protein|uniref:Uncharacterized protein n=1 Tax=Thermosporothrix hazakensis TaxID=644383 RepID=A0A326UDL4_THEHA|nr:hypothetical protein [Thermosporothrix hazakensis]PZW27496.1 hypothetical protein EI42_03583 [Thermosporothrix hazakensis]GCE45662.1 hypothetical protein KTH_05310 [Thermosporothrix hazakensis]